MNEIINTFLHVQLYHKDILYEKNNIKEYLTWITQINLQTRLWIKETHWCLLFIWLCKEGRL